MLYPFSLFAFISLTVSLQAMDNDLNKQFIKAAYEGNQSTFDKLLPKVDVNARDEDNRTALMLAAYAGHEQIVKKLLQVKGINLNAQDKYGDSALHWSIQFLSPKQQSIMMRLLAAGIDASLCNDEKKYNKTAFEELSHQPNEIQKYLSKTKEDFKHLVIAFENFTNSMKEMKCHVCAKNITNDVRSTFACGHTQFHGTCIQKIKQTICPICKDIKH